MLFAELYENEIQSVMLTAVVNLASRRGNVVSSGGSKLQFDLSSIIAAPFLFSPLLVGFGVGDQFARDALDVNAIWLHLLAVVLVYVIFFCWFATRHFDRRSDFRKFPFRGSMLLGAVVGTCFALQFSLGAHAAVVFHDFGALATAEGIAGLVVLVVALFIQSLCVGGFVGAWLGLVAGSVYCLARWIRESLTGRSTIRPGQAKRRVGVE